jgi:regulator of cell morphogenesis and NO signaling
MPETIDENITIREWVVKYPQLRRIFGSYGVDYCCGGDKALKDAAATCGADLKALKGELENAIDKGPEVSGDDDKNWAQVKPGELVDHILEKHHAFLREELPHIEKLLDTVHKAHKEVHGKLLLSLKSVFDALRTEIEGHLLKEEEILFPYINRIEKSAEKNEPLPRMHCGSVQNPIGQMEHEHDNAGSALAEMRRLTSGYTLPKDACVTFAALYNDLMRLENDLHEHIHLENNILFPKAIEMESSLVKK